jgi:hypothetical protein
MCTCVPWHSSCFLLSFTAQMCVSWMVTGYVCSGRHQYVYIYIYIYIVTYRSIARQWLDKHVYAETDSW